MTETNERHGPEPLSPDFNTDWFVKNMKSKKRNIKARTNVVAKQVKAANYMSSYIDQVDESYYEKKLKEKKETKKPENRWDICDECYSVPFPSDATMFCLKCKNNFRVWYELCNALSALDRNSKTWEECFPED